jgi:hypothetical protein
VGATKNSSAVKGSTPARDDRAERLLKICSELEPFENRIAPDELNNFIESAVFACGFHSLEEACECLIGRDLFRIWLRLMRAVAANSRLKGIHR